MFRNQVNMFIDLECASIPTPRLNVKAHVNAYLIT
jgi:hypothetical protein